MEQQVHRVPIFVVAVAGRCHSRVAKPCVLGPGSHTSIYILNSGHDSLKIMLAT